METINEKIPNPKEIEKEIGDFLAKKFGNNVKIVSPLGLPKAARNEEEQETPPKHGSFHFDLKPEELIAYLDHYVVKQDSAKEILATKICTHFNRIQHSRERESELDGMVGLIKNNVLMIGPTGVGKTYIIKLIAKKIGVPFVKGDATKFSETGYVGGDVEDLVRQLVREADDDIELAQCGIVYIDEIDKIAGSHNLIGADVSRTGVQRALLKPMEETDVDLKVPHDPISMIQEIERFRKTGQREARVVNTKNILFIMSGAFGELPEIIRRRVRTQEIGFSAQLADPREEADLLKQVKSEDLIKFGFETEFVGRLPVRSVFENLTEADLFGILKNPNNAVILGKKLDFAAYGIDIKFEDQALEIFARRAFEENTGARGLVSAIEKGLMVFEKKIPSTKIDTFAVTAEVLRTPQAALESLLNPADQEKWQQTFDRVAAAEKESIKHYLETHKTKLAESSKMTLTPSRIDIIATFYTKRTMDISRAVANIKSCYDKIKNIELLFYKHQDINIVLEEGAVDYIMEQVAATDMNLDSLYQQLTTDLEDGLKLVREKTGRNRFFLTRKALTSPEDYIRQLLQKDLPPVNERRIDA